MERTDQEKYSISEARDLAVKIKRNLILTTDGELKDEEGNFYHKNKWINVGEPNFKFQSNPSIEVSVEEYRVAAYANNSKIPMHIQAENKQEDWPGHTKAEKVEAEEFWHYVAIHNGKKKPDELEGTTDTDFNLQDGASWTNSRTIRLYDIQRPSIDRAR